MKDDDFQNLSLFTVRVCDRNVNMTSFPILCPYRLPVTFEAGWLVCMFVCPDSLDLDRDLLHIDSLQKKT